VNWKIWCIPKRYTLQKMTKFLRSFKKYNISSKRAKITNFKNLYCGVIFEGPVINATILDADVYFWTVRLITSDSSDCLQVTSRG
jgi:hypothetical protein